MHKYPILILIIILSSNVLGQDQYSNFNIDSLRMKSIECLINHDYTKANELLSVLVKRKSELKIELVPTVYNNKGIALYGIGNYAEGIKYYKLALDTYKKNKRDTLHAQALVNLGMAYKEIGADSLASRTLYQAIYKFQKLHLEKEEASAYSSLGNLYRDSKEFDRSEHYLGKAIAIQKRIDYQKGVAYSYHGLGRLMLEQERYDEAKGYFFKSLHLKNSLGLESKSASTLAQLGVLYLAMSNCDSAEFYVNKSIAIRQLAKKPNRLEIAINNLHLGEINLECGDLEKSQSHFLEATNEMFELDAKKSLVLAYEGLMKAYQETDDFDKAYSISLKLIDLNSEVLGENNQKEMARLGIEYDVKGYQQEIELKKIENDFLLKRNRILLISSIILTLLFVTILFLFRQNRKRKRKIEVQNQALVSKNQNIITLHDELSHRTNNFFSLIRGLLLTDKSPENDQLIALQISRMDAMAEVQKHLIIDGKNSISSVDLTTYIQELLEQSKILYGSGRQLSFIENLSNSPQIIIHYESVARLGIVLNELINNSLKHNKKLDHLKITIEVKLATDMLNIVYADSGEIISSSTPDGNGLKLIKQLLVPIKGEVTIERSINMITSISIPIKKGG